ncbi:hypothetical protein A2U01_0016808, partial [Trifolium medium]|nr:hypothetical protein [Trifolium medium]
MPTSNKTSPIKSDSPKSPPEDVLYSKITEAVPITTVLPEGSKKKKKFKSTVKKEKRQKVYESNPFSAKNPKIKGKKSKSTTGPRRAFTMSELYNENLDKFDVNPITEASATAIVNLSDETVKESENPKSTENLGEIDLGCSDVNKDVDGAPTKATSGSVMESPKESIPGTNAASDATPSAREEGLENNVIPDSPENVTIPEKEKTTETTVTGDVSDDNTVKDKDADVNVIDLDNLNTGESPAEKNHVPCIARRTRNRSGKVVAAVGEKTKSPKQGK